MIAEGDAGARYRAARAALAETYGWSFAAIDDMDPDHFLDAIDAIRCKGEKQPYRGVRSWEDPPEPEDDRLPWEAEGGAGSAPGNRGKVWHIGSKEDLRRYREERERMRKEAD